MIGFGLKLSKNFKQVIQDSPAWLLGNGFWDNSGTWIDAEIWND